MPPKVVRVISDGIAGAKLVVMRDVGHLPPLEAPDEVLDALAPFLELHWPGSTQGGTAHA